MRPLDMLLATILLLTPVVASSACTGKYLSRGCRRYCACQSKKAPAREACRARCEKRLTSLRERDATLARQIIDCLGSKGKRTCKVLAACAGDSLKKSDGKDKTD